jgi:hypothetical protein
MEKPGRMANVPANIFIAAPGLGVKKGQKHWIRVAGPAKRHCGTALM